MMKWFFILLLLINTAYLAWELDKDAAIARLAQPDRQSVSNSLPELKVLGENSVYPARRVEKQAEVVAPSTPVSTLEESFNAYGLRQAERINSLLGIDDSNEPVDENLGKECFRIGPFAEVTQRQPLIDWLNQRDMESFQHQTVDTSSHLYWVTLAPLADSSAASDKYAEIKSKGIKDVMIVTEGDLANAISLGIFSTQAAVNRRLLEMKSQGYQAVVVPRYNNYHEWLDIRLRSGTENGIDFDSAPFLGKKYQKIQCNEIALAQRNP